MWSSKDSFKIYGIYIANKFVYFYICRTMRENLLNAYKGIAPGKIIAHGLKKKKISQRGLAEHINEHSQTLNAIIKGRRNMTLEMAIKLDTFFGFDMGFLYMLQCNYEIEQYRIKLATQSVSGIPEIRRILFWDVDFDKINWGLRKEFAISRVLERGTEEEKKEIARFYGLELNELERYRSKNIYHINI